MVDGINNVFLGTELKLNVNIDPIGALTMDSYDFVVDVYCVVNKTLSIKKADAIRVDENNYVVLVDTKLIGSGTLKCKVIAEIPDADFEDLYRTEISIIDTGIEIQKTL